MTAEMSVVRNLMYAIESCHLDVAAMVASPYAAALSVLADDEADLGAAAHRHGRRHHHHRGVHRRPVRAWRRICARRPARHHGYRARAEHRASPTPSGSRRSMAACSPAASDERDMITVPPVNDDDHEAPQFVSRAQLVRIVKPRVEEILEMVARPARGLAVRGRAARARRADRRRLPAHRAAGPGDPDPRTAGAASAGRSASPACRRKRRVPPLRCRRACSSIRNRRISKTANRGQRGASKTGTGGYFARVGRWLRESF